MYYEINVSKNGIHFFATHERSICNYWKLEEVLKVFVDKFPESEGYNITVSRVKVDKKCIKIDINEILKGNTCLIGMN